MVDSLANSVLVQRQTLAIGVSSGKGGKDGFQGIEDVGGAALSKRRGFLGWERGLEKRV